MSGFIGAPHYESGDRRDNPHRAWAGPARRAESRAGRLRELGEELLVGREALHALDEQLEAARRAAVGGQTSQRPPQLADRGEGLRVEEELLVSSRRRLDVDRRED